MKPVKTANHHGQAFRSERSIATLTPFQHRPSKQSCVLNLPRVPNPIPVPRDSRFCWDGDPQQKLKAAGLPSKLGSRYR